MANNRMIMVCNVCIPTGNKFQYKNDKGERTKGIYIMAKWYPGSAYYFGADKEWAEDIYKFLDEHNHPEVASKWYKEGAGQENPVRIEYESEGLPIIEEKI